MMKKEYKKELRIIDRMCPYIIGHLRFCRKQMRRIWWTPAKRIAP